MLLSELSVCEIRVGTYATKKDIKELEVKLKKVSKKLLFG